MHSHLRGRVALVTGAGRGLGEIMSNALADAGAKVVLVARSKTQIDQVAADITARGADAIAIAADVSVRQQVDAAVAAAEARFGPIDILINNAGVDEPFGPIGVIDPDKWWQTQSVHVLGPMYFMSAIIPGMAERGRGHIVNICSLAGTVVQPNMSAYAVGKATEIRLTEHADAEWRDRGVHAFAIEPGTILTSMATNTLNSEEAKKWVPFGIEFLKSITPEMSEASKQRLVEMIYQLTSGQYDAISGRYLEPGDDFDALLAEHASQ